MTGRWGDDAVSGDVTGRWTDAAVSGDIVGVEMEAFAAEMSVALFSHNNRPVGTCYYTQSNRDEFLPSIGLCSNGYDIEIDVCWQNMNCGPRNFDVVRQAVCSLHLVERRE